MSSRSPAGTPVLSVAVGWVLTPSNAHSFDPKKALEIVKGVKKIEIIFSDVLKLICTLLNSCLIFWTNFKVFPYLSHFGGIWGVRGARKRCLDEFSREVQQKPLKSRPLGLKKNFIREMCSSGALGPILQSYSSISKRIFHKICRFWPKMGPKNVQKIFRFLYCFVQKQYKKNPPKKKKTKSRITKKYN